MSWLQTLKTEAPGKSIDLAFRLSRMAIKPAQLDPGAN